MNKHQEQFFLYRIRLFKDEKAFAHLYKEYHSAIWRFLSIKLPTSEVEDALSMVFIRLWNYLSGSRVENVSGLSFTIARGVIAEFYRKQSTQKEMSFSQDELERFPQQHGEAKIILGAETSLVKKALNQIDEGYRTVILLRFLEDLPLREVARRLQKTESATRTYLHRAIKHLKKQMEKIPPYER